MRDRVQVRLHANGQHGVLFFTKQTNPVMLQLLELSALLPQPALRRKHGLAGGKRCRIPAGKEAAEIRIALAES